jgi:hypothetical protein
LVDSDLDQRVCLSTADRAEHLVANDAAEQSPVKSEGLDLLLVFVVHLQPFFFNELLLTQD